MRAPGILNMDLSILRTFQIHGPHMPERVMLQVCGES